MSVLPISGDSSNIDSMIKAASDLQMLKLAAAITRLSIHQTLKSNIIGFCRAKHGGEKCVANATIVMVVRDVLDDTRRLFFRKTGYPSPNTCTYCRWAAVTVITD